MAQCKHIYKYSDGPVLQGKKKVGDRCDVSAILTADHGLCIFHARQAGKLTKNQKDKHARSIRKVHSTVREADFDLADGGLPEDILKEAKRLYSQLINDRYFDLQKYMDDIDSKTPGMWNVNDGLNKKIAFVLWYVADVETRQPREFPEVAKMLSITDAELKSWMRQKWFFAELQQHARSVTILLSPHILKDTSLKALAGDREAMKNFAKIFSSLEVSKKDVSIFNFTEEALVQAKKLTGLKKRAVIEEPEDEDLDTSVVEVGDPLSEVLQ